MCIWIFVLSSDLQLVLIFIHLSIMIGKVISFGTIHQQLISRLMQKSVNLKRVRTLMVKTRVRIMARPPGVGMYRVKPMVLQ
uniref:Uncharacterized protein n=1 Tax=Zea mays TaxID=4577 RepID=B4FJX8_MAIZE|nr:unknown [Zea mays]ACR37049.1 unknown [Zea mays]